MIKQGYKPTEIGVIPEDWEVKDIRNLATKVGSGITPTGGANVYVNEGIPFIRSQNVGWGILLLDDIAYIDKETHESFINTELKHGDVLLNITGASIGRSSIVNESIVGGNVNQHVAIIRPESSILDSVFLNQSILYENIQTQILNYQSGGNRQGLNFEQIKNLQIPLPPLPEQEAIASALSDADAWIENLEQLIAKKRLIKQGAMQTLLTPPSEELVLSGVEAWEVKKLGEVCDYKNGKSLENKISDTGVFNIISLNSIDIRGKLKKEHHKTNFNDNSLKKGDIVMVLSDVAHGNFLGLCDIIPDDNYVLNQRMGGLFNFRNIHVPFVRLLINYNQKYFKFSGKGSSQLNLGKPDILNFDLQFPSLSEQERIATILSDMDAELEALETQLGKARQIKQGMMQELLTGRIRLV